jgi:hypothetical protein
VATAVPASADWPSPSFTVIVVAVLLAVAVNVTGLPVRPLEVAASVLPALVPSVHDVTAAMPLELVVTGVVGTTVPPPLATAKVTLTPCTPFPSASLTLTDGAVATAVPASADWPSPSFTVIVVAVCCTSMEAVPLTPSTVAVMVAVPLDTAVTVPEAFTVTTSSFDDDHVNVLPGTVLPPEFLAVGCNCTVAPREVSDVVDDVISTVATEVSATEGSSSQRGPEMHSETPPPQEVITSVANGMSAANGERLM